jgi:hypothetical protein
MFRKMRGINDKVLGATLTDHQQYLRAVVNASNFLLRRQQFALAWKIALTIGLLYALVTR